MCCHRWAVRNDTILDYPRKNRTNTEFIEEYTILKERGLTVPEIARKMGVTDSAIHVALKRAPHA